MGTELNSTSGLIRCEGSLTFRELVQTAVLKGWSMDGIHPEDPEATVAELLQRVQPRPLHHGCGLIAGRCRHIEAVSAQGETYRSMPSPRKASGPDLAFLFIGGEGRLGTITHASLALMRPAPRYLVAEGAYGDWPSLFHAVQAIALLEPLSLRLIDAPHRRLRAYLPVRTPNTAPLKDRIETLGLKAYLDSSVPETERYSMNPPEGASLRVSSSFATASELLRLALERSGKKSLELAVRYPDGHGVAMILTMAPTHKGILEKLEKLALERTDIHSVSLALTPTGQDGGAEPFLAPSIKGGQR